MLAVIRYLHKIWKDKRFVLEKLLPCPSFPGTFVDMEAWFAEVPIYLSIFVLIFLVSSSDHAQIHLIVLIVVELHAFWK